MLVPLTSGVRDKCRALLPPGEELRYVFPATWLVSGVRPALTTGFFVVVTDKHVFVLAGSWWRRNVPKSIFARHPRPTRLGPVDVHPSLGATFELGGITLEVDEEYVSVVRAADLELTDDGPPQDPWPEL
jgi:hypothetical protein